MIIDNAFAIVSGIAWIGVAIFIFTYELFQKPRQEDRRLLRYIGIAATAYGIFCLKLAL